MSLHLEDSRSYLAEPASDDKFWRQPKSTQEKWLSYLTAFLMVLSFVLLVIVCVVASHNVGCNHKFPWRHTKNPTPDWMTSTTAMPPTGEECTTEICHETAQTILASMNSSVDPCDDFFEYACGGWVRRNPIPGDKGRYTTFDGLRDQVAANISEFLKRSPLPDTKSSVVRNAASIYQGCVDTDVRENVGVEPLKKIIRSLGGWPMGDSTWNESGYQWQKRVAEVTRQLGMSVIMATSVKADANDTSKFAFFLDQPNFGVGRNQIINVAGDERTRQIVAAYKSYMKDAARIMGNGDVTQIDKDVEEVVHFESLLAQLTRSPESRRDATTWYHKTTIDQLQKNVPEVSWKEFLNEILVNLDQVDGTTPIIVMEEEYLKGMVKVISETSARTISNYLGWRVVKTLAPLTTKEFQEVNFGFQKVLLGIQKQQEMERVCADTTNTLLGFAVGRLYIDLSFSEDAKRNVNKMVKQIRSAYHATLETNKWMDDNTRNKALNKLEEMINMIAYPDWLKDDAQLDDYYAGVGLLAKDEFFQNVVKVIGALAEKIFKRWNQPTNRTTEWLSAPAVVNAFYNPSANTITFPGGILNAPFYSYGRPAYANFGAIGSVIGHEISHGFDDQGSQYDAEGNLVNWWTKSTREKFTEKAKCFIDQYSNYVEPETQMNLNGNNSVGENIADNGGVRNSFKAYRVYTALYEDDANNGRLPGVAATPEQLFFIAYAGVWCGSVRREAMEFSIQYDTHSPNMYRVLVPLTNSKDFAKAFNCPEGSKMNPKEKCILW